MNDSDLLAQRMQSWRTDDKPEKDQYAYWREVVCAAFTTLSPASRGSERDHWDRGGLPGWVNSLQLGTTNGAEVQSCEQLIRHGRAEVSAMKQPVVFVNLQLRGRSVVTQDGRTCLSGPGTFSLVDATRPFTLDYLDTWRTVSFRLPVESLGSLTSPDRGVTARTFSATRGIGSVLAQTMRSLWREAPDLDQLSAEAGAAAVSALACAIDDRWQADRHTSDATTIEALRGSIQEYVASNLEFADVRPEAVATHFAISVRRLHQLYEGQETTFGQMVMLARARRCAEDLLWDPAMSLTDAAARWGFSDLSHMNRVFRRLFGLSPAEVRVTSNDERQALALAPHGPDGH